MIILFLEWESLYMYLVGQYREGRYGVFCEYKPLIYILFHSLQCCIYIIIKKLDHILYSASATAVLCTPLCNIGPYHSGTWVYNIFIRNITVKEFNSLP